MEQTKQSQRKKKNLGTALADSINAEEKSVTSRFDKADELFRAKGETEGSPRVPVPKPAEESQEPEKTEVSSSKPLPKKKEKPAKVIRDTFSMPPHDYDRIYQIIQQCLKNGISINKSEVVRAGLIALQKMPSKELTELLQILEKLKPGRRS
jgi:Arc/MetJ-type ribon-helix-helix transcriptional regulator